MRVFAYLRRIVFEPVPGVVVDPVQQLFIRFEMLGEPVILSGVFTGFDTVLLANVRSGFVNAAFVIRRQELTNGIDHDVPAFTVNIK